MRQRPAADQRVSRAHSRGLTFIELMVTLIVMAILLSLGVPAVQEFVVNNQTTTHTNQIVADVALARSQALALSNSVRISATGGQWKDGWLIASDGDQNGLINGAGERADAAIRQQEAVSTDFQVAVVDAGGTALTSLWFNRLGAGVQKLPGGVTVDFPVTVTITRPDGDTDKSKTVCVAASGVAIARKGVVSC